eukprot:scaffold952_cov409-Prasinococcus_capsulatus_cf.AAC.11
MTRQKLQLEPPVVPSPTTLNWQVGRAVLAKHETACSRKMLIGVQTEVFPHSRGSTPFAFCRYVYPGLFAAGLLDIMSAYMLKSLPTIPKHARVLDYCSGSGWKPVLSVYHLVDVAH